MEKDPAKAIPVLQEAVSIDPKYAQAHWFWGEKTADPAQRLEQWKLATGLAPRKYEWWAQYAQLCVDQKKFAEAGRAWVAAAQAAPDAAHREQYLAARSVIDQQRLEAEDQERRKDAEAKAREMERLKAQARQEVRDIEARANRNSLSEEDAAKAVPWWDANEMPPATLSGTLLRVECAGSQFRLVIRKESGQLVRLGVRDPKVIEVSGGDLKLACGTQVSKAVSVTYTPAKNTKLPVSGEATAIALR
jgi:hypothetical protein